MHRWDGYFLRKKPLVRKPDEDDAEAIKENEEANDRSDGSVIKEKKEEKDKISIPSWKLSLPDEFADIKFYNKNFYRGRISRKMMEGEGTYRWHNGIYYKVSRKYVSIAFNKNPGGYKILKIL